MQLLDDHLWTLFEAGVISAEDMIDKARDYNAAIERILKAGKSVSRTELKQAETPGG